MSCCTNASARTPAARCLPVDRRLERRPDPDAGSCTATSIPAGALLLTDWGPTHDRWFRSGPRAQAREARRLAAEFPGALAAGRRRRPARRELYGEFAAAHPADVAAVAIRQLTPGEAVLAGGRSEEDPAPATAPWHYAPDGAGLSAS